MSDFLFLASDYIERMSNPVHGAATNEDYTVRFAAQLGSEGFEARLNDEIRSLTDRTTLTSFGWLWLFGWAMAKDLQLNENLLIELYEEWSSVFFRARIVDLVTRNSDYRDGRREYFTVAEFPHRFLSTIMSRVTRRPEADRTPREISDLGLPLEAPPPTPVLSTARAVSTLVALLQVGKPITLAAASVLLRHEWEGHAQLLQSFWGICNSLDVETRVNWIDTLEPPQHA